MAVDLGAAVEDRREEDVDGDEEREEDLCFLSSLGPSLGLFRSKTSRSSLVFFFCPNFGLGATPPLLPVQLGMPVAAGAQRRREALNKRRVKRACIRS